MGNLSSLTGRRGPGTPLDLLRIDKHGSSVRTTIPGRFGVPGRSGRLARDANPAIEKSNPSARADGLLFAPL